MIDMRSDTVSKPTPEMRDAMASAEVGDDVYGDDPTVNALERRTAEILGKEDAVYMPTGTMTNQVALRTHTEAGDEVLTDINAHLYVIESGAPGALSGLTIRPLMGINGIFSASDVHQAIRVPHRFMPSTVLPPTRLLCAENTHNMAGGVIWPIDAIRDAAEAARSHGLATHLDGARLWHATVATGIPEADYAACFDSVGVCFSKGLGAPVGSALAGSAVFIARARRFKHMFGGGFRQAGIVAAGALYALENHRKRLAEDHEKAQALAAGLDAIPAISIDVSLVQTNIVRFRILTMSASEFVDRCYEEGLYMLPSGRDQLRAVMHIGLSQDDVEAGLSIIKAVVK
jgi:threonine aldolase